MNKTEIIKDWYKRVWVDRDFDAVDEYFSPSSQAQGLLPDFAFNADDFREFAPVCLELMQDVEVSVDLVIENGDWASALTSMRAINPATGAPVACQGQLFARFEEGKIIEAYNAFDFMSFFVQLGLLPPHTLELCLSGQKIT